MGKLFKSRKEYYNGGFTLLDNYFKFTPEQKKKAEEDNYYFPFLVLRRKTYKKTTFLMRLSVIPWVICWIILFLCLPVAYLVSGECSYSETTPPFAWFFDWSRRLGIYD